MRQVRAWKVWTLRGAMLGLLIDAWLLYRAIHLANRGAGGVEIGSDLFLTASMLSLPMAWVPSLIGSGLEHLRPGGFPIVLAFITPMLSWGVLGLILGVAIDWRSARQRTRHHMGI